MFRKLSVLSLLLLLLGAACQNEPTGPISFSDGGSLQPAAVVMWKGHTFTVRGAASAAVDGSDNLIITRLGLGDVGVELLTPAVNANGTPWMLFSYVDNGPTVLQGYDMFINPDVTTARISGGSLFSCDGLGYERYSAAPALEDFLFVDNCGARAGGPHTLYVGERADGTVDAIFDGGLWKGTFLKDNGAAPFAFNHVFLRVRGGSVGDTFTFTDFRAGDNHPGGGNKNACKNGGWSASGLWKNQGACNQYANNSDKKAQEISGS